MEKENSLNFEAEKPLGEEEKKEMKKIIEILGEEELKKTREMVKRVEEECKGDEDLEKFFEEANDYFIRYTETLFQMRELLNKFNKGEITEEEFKEESEKSDSEIQIIHKAARDSLRILVRNMTKKGKNTAGIEGFVDNAAYGKLAAEVAAMSLPDLVEADMKLYQGEKEEEN